MKQREKENIKDDKDVLKQKNNKCLIRDTTTAVSQLQWSQGLKNILMKQTVKLQDCDD